METNSKYNLSLLENDTEQTGFIFHTRLPQMFNN